MDIWKCSITESLIQRSAFSDRKEHFMIFWPIPLINCSTKALLQFSFIFKSWSRRVRFLRISFLHLRKKFICKGTNVLIRDLSHYDRKIVLLQKLLPLAKNKIIPNQIKIFLSSLFDHRNKFPAITVRNTAILRVFSQLYMYENCSFYEYSAKV